MYFSQNIMKCEPACMLIVLTHLKLFEASAHDMRA
jgi:hypothetical protein